MRIQTYEPRERHGFFSDRFVLFVHESKRAELYIESIGTVAGIDRDTLERAMLANGVRLAAIDEVMAAVSEEPQAPELPAMIELSLDGSVLAVWSSRRREGWPLIRKRLIDQSRRSL